MVEGGSEGHCFAAWMDGNHIQKLLARAKEPGIEEAAKYPNCRMGQHLRSDWLWYLEQERGLVL